MDVGSWIGQKLGDGVHFVLSPVIDAIGYGIKAVAVAGLHALPGVATVCGLFCFILTIAMGNRKPYGWGLMFLAISAIAKVIAGELGV